jgi:hypothetical protein
MGWARNRRCVQRRAFLGWQRAKPIRINDQRLPLRTLQQVARLGCQSCFEPLRDALHRMMMPLSAFDLRINSEAFTTCTPVDILFWNG